MELELDYYCMWSCLSQKIKSPDVMDIIVMVTKEEQSIQKGEDTRRQKLSMHMD
jgi:hypothetical protein